MAHEPRQITFLGREGPTKRYAIGNPDASLIEATRALAEPGVPGFTIAHQGQGGGDGARLLVGAGERGPPARVRRPLRPDELQALTDTGMACVWELEVIDFERRAWLQDVLIGDDVEAYLERALDPVAV